MIKQGAVLLLLASGTAIAADANSNEIRFNHLGADYLYSESGDADGDGFGVDLNVALTSYLFADVDYSTRSLEANGIDVDLEFFSGGIGGNYALNEDKSIQLFGTVSWEQLDFDFGGAGGGGNGGDGGGDGGGDTGGGTFCTGTPLDALTSLLTGDDCTGNGGGLPAKALSLSGGSSRTDGYGASVGVRAIVWDNLEVSGQYSMRDFSSDGDDSFYGVSVNYAIGDWVAVLSFDQYDDLDLDEYSLGVRYTFGKEDGGGSIW